MPKHKTPKQVRAEFLEAGITVAEWCRLHGFNRMTVVDLLLGRQKGVRGAAHRAAVALGLKHGTVVDPRKFKVPLAANQSAARRKAA
ncbi:MAG TPA: DNA-binding protein [Rubrivivax sp.]|jgi:gp16 family phage-associated protein|nr:DNA-binding protein [Rubrivivax sp.]